VDAQLIRRVFINIIDNAIEANGGKGEVIVETSYQPELNLARVVVADDGPGVPPEDQDKLFMPYYSTKRRGSGLGLAIVKRIVAEHRGHVRVEKNRPRGACFVVELPVENADTPAGDRDEQRVTSRS